MTPNLAHLALLAVLAVPALPGIQVFGGPGERGATTLVFFGEMPLGMVGIQYGRPAWSDDYDARLNEVRGQDLRLGKDNWTTMNTDVDLTLADESIPAGVYFLGLRCDDEGEFQLLAFEASAATARKAVPFIPPQWGDADVVIPLEHEKTERRHETMSMSLASDADEPAKITLTIGWGPHELTAGGAAHLPE